MKKNVPLIIGLAIPLLMIVFVAISIYIPTFFAHPRYSFVYSASDQNYYTGDSYSVQNGKVIKQTTTYPTTNTPPGAPVPPVPAYPKSDIRLYVYDVSTDSAKEISLADAQKLILTGDMISPEGYHVEQGSNDRGVFDIFGGYTSSLPTWYMKKGAINKKMSIMLPPSATNYYNGNFQFLGWIKQ